METKTDIVHSVASKLKVELSWAEELISMLQSMSRPLSACTGRKLFTNFTVCCELCCTFMLSFLIAAISISVNEKKKKSV